MHSMENLLWKHLKLIKWFKIKRVTPTAPDVICKLQSRIEEQHIDCVNDSHVKQLWEIHTRYFGFGTLFAVRLD